MNKAIKKGREMSFKGVKSSLVITGLLPLLLSACDRGQGDDLDQFMANAAINMSAEVDSLPKVLPYKPMPYNADGKLRNPFEAYKKKRSSSTFQPNTSRSRELLESFPLGDLLYVGSLSKKQMVYALIQTPEKHVHQVRVGNHLGTNFGLITSIKDSEVIVKEVIRDEINDKWIERNASINLQE